MSDWFEIESMAPDELRALLPAPQDLNARWVIKRKAALIRLYDIGEISEVQIVRDFSMSIEEMDSWRTHLQRGGVTALRQTRIQQNRR